MSAESNNESRIVLLMKKLRKEYSRTMDDVQNTYKQYRSANSMCRDQEHILQQALRNTIEAKKHLLSDSCNPELISYAKQCTEELHRVEEIYQSLHTDSELAYQIYKSAECDHRYAKDRVEEWTQYEHDWNRRGFIYQ
jgi:hypothetical protein